MESIDRIVKTRTRKMTISVVRISYALAKFIPKCRSEINKSTLV